jgi:hypothetical protein
MNSQKNSKSSPRPMSRHVLLLAGLAAAWLSQSAMADCPPGYLPKAGHCIPGPVHTRQAQSIVSTQHPPLAVSPLNAAKSSAPNLQPIPSGKAALNPQPIPPGRLLPKTAPRPPRGGDPLKWDIKANKQS